MDLYGNRHDEQYIYKRVRWSDWRELETYPYITGGSVEFAEDAALKVSGAFDFEGSEQPNTDDLLRVYYRFTDDNGETGIYPISTFFVSFSQLQYAETLKGTKVRGSLDANSVLKVLDDKVIGTPYVVYRNTGYIAEAARLIQSLGLNVDYTPSSSKSIYDHIFDSGTTYLEIVNWLCEQAGYVDAYPDAYGTVVMKSLNSIRKDLSEIVLETNDRSIIYPDIEKQNDYLNTPNVVRYILDTESTCVIATAKNVSGSRSSLDMRGGREQTEYEEIDDVPAGQPVEQSLRDKAEARIKELATDIEYVDYQHAYIPMQLYQSITLRYGDMTWSGLIDNYSIELAPGAKVQSKLRRDTEQNIIVDLQSEIIRGTGN